MVVKSPSSEVSKPIALKEGFNVTKQKKKLDY